MKAGTILFFALVSVVQADLKWDHPQQNFTVKPGETAVVAKYRFTNAGKAPVTIDAVRTSCGCTTATLVKKEYLPGESGEIEARFEVGNRVGHQEKTILVTTNDAPRSPAALQLIVDIPETVKVDPQFVYWRIGEAPEPKTIEVTVLEDSPAKIVSVASDTPAVKVAVEDALPGKKVTLRVTPADTSHADGGTLVIRTDYPAENPQARYAYARIK